VRDVRFHYPMRGMKLTSVGSIHVRPWSKKHGRQLLKTCQSDACFTERERVKLVAKNVEEGRKFRAR